MDSGLSSTFGKMLLFALSLTVAAVPNSLPVIVTVGLSLGTKRLAKNNMLIKKLPAAESLGSVTVICSDKTGTITKNQMTITEIYTDHKKIEISGSGYEPKGNFSIDNEQINPKKLDLLLRIGYLCNNAKLVEKKGRYSIIGDPTEGSLIVLGEKGKLSEKELKKDFSFIEELPFDSDRKRMTVIYKNKHNKKIEAYVKGAPDLLLEKCDRILENGRVRFLTRKDKRQLLKMNNAFAEKALRVLGLAYRDLKSSKEYNLKNVEKNLTFVGLVGMIWDRLCHFLNFCLPSRKDNGGAVVQVQLAKSLSGYANYVGKRVNVVPERNSNNRSNFTKLFNPIDGG